METRALEIIAKECSTPCYIYDTDDLRKRVNEVHNAFGNQISLCFSMKANPFLLQNLPAQIAKIEVCSPGELNICEKLGVDPHKIIFSGVNKTEEDVHCAVCYGVDVITVESMKHLRLIEAEGQKQNQKVGVLIRIAKDSQFGMEALQVQKIIEKRNEYPHVEIEGIHYFTGTQKRKSKEIIKEVDNLSDFLETTEERLSFRIKRIEYGTGLAVDYFADDADQRELLRLDEISDAMKKLAQKAELTVEMGRFFAASCGYYLTTVVDTKTNNRINYAICDGGINQLKYDGQFQGMQTPQISCIHRTDESPNTYDRPSKWTVCGSLCTTADVLARDVDMGNLSEGDILVFKRAGAYSLMEGMTTFLSREAALVALYSQQNGLRVVRPALPTDPMNTAGFYIERKA